VDAPRTALLPAPVPLPIPYPVFVRAGVVDQLHAIVDAVAPAHRYAIISDLSVASHHAAAVQRQFPTDRTRLFTIPPGEHEKTRARWAELTDALLDWGAGRDTTVVALGGGVVGDLAGFVAATYMRGIPVVQVPTTLLAMVDASVGGKTAVDTPQGKNLVGAFHDPRAVVMDPALLATLSLPDLRSGLAEMIKHGVLADRAYFDALLVALPDIRALGAHAPQFASLIAGSVAIKAAVVAEDHKEHGRRQTLNFGHTIAHAIERVLEYRILHGEAVAIGMIVEARLAERLKIAEPGTADTVESIVRTAGLPAAIPRHIAAAELLAATRGDKKNRAGGVRYSLPCSIGNMDSADGSWSVAVEDSVVRDVLA
jgi:3-dehydroquinate synthase